MKLVAHVRDLRSRVQRIGAASVALAVLGAAVVAGCGSGGKTAGGNSGEKKNIYVFLYAPRGFNDASKAWANGFDQAQSQLGDKYSVKLKTTTAPDLDPAHYLNFIRSGVVPKPDGMVVIPNNGPAMTQGLEALRKRLGIPLLIMDAPAPKVDQVAFVGTNNANAGAQAAKYLISQYRTGKLPSNQIAVLGQPPGASSIDERVSGFLGTIKGGPLKVVQITLPKGVDLASGRTALADILVAKPKLGGVFATSDVYALGAAKALAAANRRNIALVSVDATAEGIKLMLKDGSIDAEVAQHLQKMGYTAVSTLAKALDGKGVPKNIDTGTTLVTRDNAKEYLKVAAREAQG